MKTIKQLLITTMLLLCGIAANAYDFGVDGIYYNIINTSSVEVTYKSYSNNSAVYTGKVIIPETVTYNGITYSVTSIGSLAFSECWNLTDIEIPNSVKSIRTNSFTKCTGLTSITIPNSVTSIESATGSASFSYCTGLKKVELHTTKVDAWFRQNTSIKEIILGSSVTSIENYAFEGCTGLTSITIGNSVTNIGNNAFSGCSSLTSVTIPNCVTNIGSYAFNKCSRLTSITIPNSVTSIARSTFADCSNLLNIDIPDGIKTIGSYAFSGCTNLLNIDIPNGVKKIEEFTFSDCTNLKRIKFPGSVTHIANNVFNNSNINHIIFEAGADTLSLGYIYSTNKPLFYSCNIDSVFINRNIKYKDNYPPFEGNNTLKYIEIGQDVTYIPKKLFNSQSNAEFKIGNNLEFIDEAAFSECNKIKEIAIGSPGRSRVTIGQYAFSNCSNLENIHISNAVIERYSFYNCTSLNRLVIDDDVTYIGQSAFAQCTSLQELKTGDGIRTIESSAFKDCLNLKEITIGKRVNGIGDWAFGNCNNIETIYALPTRAINCNQNIFPDKVYKYANLYVKKSAIESYDTTEPWFKFFIEAMSDFTLTYIIDGEIYKEEKYELDAKVVPLSEPTKEGHTFSGWSEIPKTMPANDITVEGSFTINSYNVIYKVDGKEYKTESVEYGTELVLAEQPTKEGHTFSGWSETPETMPANDITVEGSFTVNSYNVIYKVDGEEYKTESVEYGTKIVLAELPTKEGHTFSGWSEAPETMPANDITVEGSFTVNSYNVIYKVDGEEYKTESVEYGTKIVLAEQPTKEGHTFSGWSEAPETMPANDITVEGSFTVNSYNVIYKVDGEEYKTESVEYGTKIVLAELPTKEGHTFSGWSEAPETMPANDITVEGSFTVNSYNVIYKVDGEEYKTESVEYGTKIVLAEQPTKEGHTFSGWSETPETMPAEDIVIFGSYKVNNYKLIYIIDNTIYSSSDVEYGSTIEPIDEPQKEGHSFNGWVGIPNTMPAKDVVIIGSFSVNSYTVTFMIDGEVYETATVKYGTEIELPTVPEKEGYTFSGWSEAPETMPANDIVIEGYYTVNTDIRQIIMTSDQKEVYNLNGVRITDIEGLSRGIYIVNGKKIFVK